MRYKYPEISLLPILRADKKEWDALKAKWVKVIKKHEKGNGDMLGLGALLYGMQRGMSSIAKAGMSNPLIAKRFAFFTRIIEQSAKAIIRKKYPSVLDAGRANLNLIDEMKARRELFNKRRRDEEIRSFLANSRF